MPFLADISVPWVIVAMIFISFLRFLLDKIKGPGTEEEGEETHLPGQRPPPPHPAGTGGRPQTSPQTAAEDFRRLLETLREEREVPAPRPPSPAPPPLSKPTRSLSPAPPPLSKPTRPGHRPSVSPPPLSRSSKSPAQASVEQAAAAKAFRKHSREPAPSKVRSGEDGPRSLGAMLRDPDSLRQAVILREVLGPPLALRPHEEDLY